MHSDCQRQKEVMALPELASQFRDFCMCVFVGFVVFVCILD